ncbi:MAG: 2-oxoglutarate ferredoxin oxidoreductase subunit alpha [Chloroflexota bacterium]
MKRYLETGNFAIAQGAMLAGCRMFVGYPITPATELAEAMSRHLPSVGGYYVQAEDECAAMHICIGGALGGLKVMTGTSGPGYILYADPYGWAIASEIPIVVLNSGRVGPVSGITGAPGQGEFYNVRFPTQGGNFETIVLAPNSAQEAMQLTIEAFYLSERFRTPVTLLADQLVTDGMEDISIPETDEEKQQMGLRFKEREICRGPEFYPPVDAIDLPPVVLGHNTGALCSDWTPTEEGYDTEEVESCHKRAYRLIYKIRNHRDLITRYEAFGMDDAELVVASFGTPSRVVKSAVKQAREKGMKVGALRLISLWPFPDELFQKKTTYLSVELNYDGQLVREIKRACPKDSQVHFMGQCGELPRIDELLTAFRGILDGKNVSVPKWQGEAW